MNRKGIGRNYYLLLTSELSMGSYHVYILLAAQYFVQLVQDDRRMGNKEFSWKLFHVISSNTRFDGVVDDSKRYIPTFICFPSRINLVVCASVGIYSTIWWSNFFTNRAKQRMIFCFVCIQPSLIAKINLTEARMILIDQMDKLILLIYVLS